MPFYEVLTQFLDVSGRRDLGTPGDLSTTVDNGAGKLINAGQKLLDRLAENTNSFRRWQKDITAGSLQVTVQGLRVIKEVYLTNDEGSVWLEKKTVREIRNWFPKPISLLDRGQPLYYVPNIIRLGGDQVDLSTADYTDYFTRDDEDLDIDCECPDGALRGVYLMPPADAGYTLTIVGRFFSKKLVENDDESYWTEVNPTALVYAALYTMERFYRNTEGAKDWMDALRLELQGDDYDVAEEEAVNINDIVR